MPSALLTCLLTPLGLGKWPLWVFENSLELLVRIAATVGSWPGANIGVSQPPLLSFSLIVFGGLWLCLWQMRWRMWGFLPVGVGLLGTCWQDQPNILVDGQGKLVGMYDKETLYVSSIRKGKFTAESWKQYLAARDIQGLKCTEGVCKAMYQDTPILISHHSDNQPCVKGAILIRLEPSVAACPEAALTIDWYDLWRRGGHALWIREEKVHVKHVNAIQGQRPWTRRAIPRKERP
jgi:competence protein ComEC